MTNPFLNPFLDLLCSTATTYGDARVTITSSQAYKLATRLDYISLATLLPDDGHTFKDISLGWQRYVNSKLGSLYLCFELDKRIRAKGNPNVHVNTCHPGISPLLLYLIYPVFFSMLAYSAKISRWCPNNRPRLPPAASHWPLSCLGHQKRHGRLHAPVLQRRSQNTGVPECK